MKYCLYFDRFSVKAIFILEIIMFHIKEQMAQAQVSSGDMNERNQAKPSKKQCLRTIAAKGESILDQMKKSRS